MFVFGDPVQAPRPTAVSELFQAAPPFLFGGASNVGGGGGTANVAQAWAPFGSDSAEAAPGQPGDSTDDVVAGASAGAGGPGLVTPKARRGPGRVRMRGAGVARPAAAAPAAEPPQSAASAATASSAAAAPAETPPPKPEAAGETSLEVALARAWDSQRQQLYAQAIKGLLPELGLPGDALDLLHMCVEAWEQEEVKRGEDEALRFKVYVDEKNCLQSQLLDARSRLKEMREKLQHERDTERMRRVQAEEALSGLRYQLSTVQQESSRIRQLLATSQAATRRAMAAANRSPSREELITHFAELECEPLRLCDSQGRGALKKRILLKWHPDKQPSTDHATLATAVMQELQNRCEWSW